MNFLTFVTDTGAVYAFGKEYIVLVTVDSERTVMVEVCTGATSRRYFGKENPNWDFLVDVGLKAKR